MWVPVIKVTLLPTVRLWQVVNVLHLAHAHASQGLKGPNASVLTFRAMPVTLAYIAVATECAKVMARVRACLGIMARSVSALMSSPPHQRIIAILMVFVTWMV